jgi:hypothetical protein
MSLSRSVNLSGLAEGFFSVSRSYLLSLLQRVFALYYVFHVSEKELKSEYIHQRIEPELKKEFRSAAKKDHRSMASALVVAVSDYIKKITGKEV